MAGFWDAVGPYVQVVLPTIVVALIFWFVMKAILNADRHEREAANKEHEEADRRIAARAEQLRAQQRSSGHSSQQKDMDQGLEN